MTTQDIVSKFLAGFNHAEYIQESFALLHEDYKFKNPIVELNSKEEFIVLANQIAQVVKGIEVKEMTSTSSGNWVTVFYDFKTDIKGLESNLATEWFRVEDNLIRESTLIYDASEWRKFYAQMKN